MDHKWREGILKEAVNLSYSRALHAVREVDVEIETEEPMTKTSSGVEAYRVSPEKKRPPIPQVLLQAAEVEEKRWTAPTQSPAMIGKGHYLKARDVRRMSASRSAIDVHTGQQAEMTVSL